MGQNQNVFATAGAKQVVPQPITAGLEDYLGYEKDKTKKNPLTAYLMGKATV